MDRSGAPLVVLPTAVVRKYVSQNHETNTRSKKMRVKCIQLTTFLFALSCVSFVIIQGFKCWIKFKSNPQTTQVSIVKATRYPDITFCPDWDFNKKRSDDCNISINSYFEQNQWNGTLNCSDPIKLHKAFVGDVTDVVTQITLYDGDFYAFMNSMNVDLDDPSNFRVLDFPNGNGRWGRCYSLQWDPTFNTVSVHFFFSGQTFVSIHPPGNFLEHPDKATVMLKKGSWNTAIVLYETFNVLSFDGELCQNDEAYSRDDCLYSAIQEVTEVKLKNYFHFMLLLQESEKELGCTTPYHPDKSNICIEGNTQFEARRIFNNILLYNQTKAKKLCPKPCQQYIISLNKEGSNISSSFTSLTMEFPKYVRVSSSYYSYNLLELLAEVGGYFGLFLGVSIIQISSLVKILMAKLDQYVKNRREKLPQLT